jgi:hypothetical protein
MFGVAILNMLPKRIAEVYRVATVEPTTTEGAK